MSVDDKRPTSAHCADTSDSPPAAAVTSSLLTDDATSDDGATKSVRSSKSHSVQIREPPVTDARGQTAYTQQTIVVSQEKRGPLHRAIPSMPLPLAVVACILNIILPGTGSRHSILVILLVSASTRLCNTEHGEVVLMKCVGSGVITQCQNR